jgi:hypothetical protein
MPLLMLDLFLERMFERLLRLGRMIVKLWRATIRA